MDEEIGAVRQSWSLKVLGLRRHSKGVSCYSVLGQAEPVPLSTWARQHVWLLWADYNSWRGHDFCKNDDTGWVINSEVQDWREDESLHLGPRL